MDKIEAAEWADALDSGEFTQGRRALVKCGMYCCLGVKASINNNTWNDGELRYPIDMTIKERKFFIRLNDKLKYDFPQIADIIRQRYQVDA